MSELYFCKIVCLDPETQWTSLLSGLNSVSIVHRLDVALVTIRPESDLSER